MGDQFLLIYIDRRLLTPAGAVRQILILSTISRSLSPVVKTTTLVLRRIRYTIYTIKHTKPMTQYFR